MNYNELQVGFNMRKVTKGAVTIKLWDLGGQPRFRSMWERYCRLVANIIPGLSQVVHTVIYIMNIASGMTDL